MPRHLCILRVITIKFENSSEEPHEYCYLNAGGYGKITSSNEYSIYNVTGRVIYWL